LPAAAAVWRSARRHPLTWARARRPPRHAAPRQQACEGLAETGVIGAAEWLLLLGPGLQPRKLEGGVDEAAAARAEAPPPPVDLRQPFHELFSLEVESSPGGSRVVAAEQTDLPDGTHRSEEVVVHVTDLPGGQRLSEASLLTETDLPDGRHVSEEVLVSGVPGSGSGAAGAGPRAVVEKSHHETLDRWPSVNEGDGGRLVHALHVALQNEGCYPDDDDIRWWHYGDSTAAAVKTFQASRRPGKGGQAGR
jgi:peptidoglycan hydrolase-like protein with peptidoglycan-binding domain